MIYALLALSVSLNATLVWYIRKLLNKYWSDIEVREKFTEMLGQYAESLMAIYKLEEIYGEEIIKKAINETKFVQEACEEYKKILETEVGQEAAYEEDEGENEENSQTKDEKDNQKGKIFIKEGEKITQDAQNYRRVQQADF
jgi:hypothetical protein